MSQLIPLSEIERDIDLITQAMHLCGIIRYMNQRFWEPQTEATNQALAIDTLSPQGNPVPRSESVADHTWHMTYMVMVIAPRFPQLDINRCMQLATLHDLLEIFTGDFDPLGKAGDGTDTHAFNADKKHQKDEAEHAALAHYLTLVNDVAAGLHKDIITDTITMQSLESRFVKTLDRLQPYIYIIARKDGVMDDGHLAFSLRHMALSYSYFPEMKPYHDVLRQRFLQSFADNRNISVDDLAAQFSPPAA